MRLLLLGAGFALLYRSFNKSSCICINWTGVWVLGAPTCDPINFGVQQNEPFFFIEKNYTICSFFKKAIFIFSYNMALLQLPLPPLFITHLHYSLHFPTHPLIQIHCPSCLPQKRAGIPGTSTKHVTR